MVYLLTARDRFGVVVEHRAYTTRAVSLVLYRKLLAAGGSIELVGVQA